MKAIVCTKYGSPEVLQLREVAKPAPADDEVLIRICAASVNARDWRFMRANPFFIRLRFGLLKPVTQILGGDLAGQVAAVGREVRKFQPEDEVFGFLWADSRSTFAEYVCAKEDEVALKPANLSYEQAAAVPLAAITALQGLRDKGSIQKGQKVLIQGASGGVGTCAVQIAKLFGAEVTGVCSTKNLELVRSLGADRVIDYTREDFTLNGQRYDLILAVNGFHPISHYLRALNPDGTCVVAGGSMLQIFQAGLQARKSPGTGKQKVVLLSLAHDPQDLLLVKGLLESGKIRPVIDGCYPLAKTADALRYFDQVHPKGKVVITTADNKA